VPTLRVFLAAEEAAGARALRLLARSGHDVVGVLAGRGNSGRASVTAAAAARAGIPVVPAETVDDGALAALLDEHQIDLFLNVHSLRILGPEVLVTPRIGAFNLHPGPLPRYAGLNAPSWAIYEQESTFGCSMHWMTPELDAGPIAYAARFDVDPRETALSLSLKCVEHGLPLLERLLTHAATGEAIPAQAQSAAERRRLPPGPPGDGWVPWAAAAARVDALARACAYAPFPSPWGWPRTHVAGREVAITRLRPTGRPADAGPGTVGASVDGGVLVATRDEWVAVDEVQVAGERRRPGSVMPAGTRCEPVAAINPP
jgi:methionyl-tRNA formyltransferase